MQSPKRPKVRQTWFIFSDKHEEQR